MHIHKPSLLSLILTLACGCGSSSSSSSAASSTCADFAVLSDVHLHDTATLGGTRYDAFNAYLASDRKMLAQSEEILDAALADLESTSLDFVLVSGDLTKDGEEVNHRLMAEKLAAFEAATGARVYVVPGNHDVDNANAYDYVDDVQAASVTSAEFRQIYAEFGYGDAVAQDPDSLSYVAEPLPGIWLLAVDSAEWDDATGTQQTAGRIRDATHAWIVARLTEAAARGKTVIGMMHHGVIEHFTGQATLFPEYLLENDSSEGQALAEAGMNIVFTGHFHANDVVERSYGNSTLRDVETGSLVTPPSPYRVTHLDGPSQTYSITTRHVTRITSHPDDFTTWSAQYLQDGLEPQVTALLETYGFDATTAAALSATYVTPGMIAHYAGDESPSAEITAGISAMTSSSDPTTAYLGTLIQGLWTDLSPSDNTVTFQTK